MAEQGQRSYEEMTDGELIAIRTRMQERCYENPRDGEAWGIRFELMKIMLIRHLEHS